MEKWIYTTGTDGATSIIIEEIAGKLITGRVYRSGMIYRPKQGSSLVNKEYDYTQNAGRLDFAYPFDGSENLDIPYEQD